MLLIHNVIPELVQMEYVPAEPHQLPAQLQQLETSAVQVQYLPAVPAAEQHMPQVTAVLIFIKLQHAAQAQQEAGVNVQFQMQRG